MCVCVLFLSAFLGAFFASLRLLRVCTPKGRLLQYLMGPKAATFLRQFFFSPLYFVFFFFSFFVIVIVVFLSSYRFVYNCIELWKIPEFIEHCIVVSGVIVVVFVGVVFACVFCC